MQTFFIIAILVLGFLITFQIAKASEYVAIMRGEEKAKHCVRRVAHPLHYFKTRIKRVDAHQ